jgi:U3 small nucleolar RNA-associated protein 20
MQKLTHDLRSTLSSKYSDILSRLLGLLPRSLSAASFSALMETLSALFKYLLIPSSDEFLVESSWSQLRVVLPSANPEVQRAVAEVWGSVLRRLRLASREKALSSLIHDLYGVEDAAAWALVFSCKVSFSSLMSVNLFVYAMSQQSVSQTLHTSSAALLKPIFHMHLEGHAPALTFSLVRRVMTALIHHCKSAVEFTPVTDLVLSILKHEVGRSSDEHKHGRICRTLELAFVACAVREGSRLTRKSMANSLDSALIPA